MGRILRCLSLSLGLAVAGCGLLGDQFSTRTTIRGVPPDLERIPFQNIVAGTTAETELLKNLLVRAGLEGRDARTLTAPEWRLVLLAGLRVVDGQCDQYMDALFRFNREQRAARQGLAAVAATTGGIMGLASAPASAIAATAAAFGLSSSLFDAGVNSVLFTIEPSALRNVVLEGRRKYLEGIRGTSFPSRPETMTAIQGYLTQCSPAAIEANINNAANGSMNAVTNPRTPEGRNPALIAAPATVLSFADQPVLAPPLPPPVQNGDVRLSGEENVTADDIRRMQRLLGVMVDGTIGPEGSRTRWALQEFQRGMQQRLGDAPEAARWQDHGRVSPAILAELRRIRPDPATPFQTPFERAFLGKVDDEAGASVSLDPSRVGYVWSILFPAVAEGPGADALDRVRAEIKRCTGDATGALTSALWARVSSATPCRAAPPELPKVITR